MSELDRLWMGTPLGDNLHLPPAWVLVYYGLGFTDDVNTRTTDVTDREIIACL